MTQPEALRLADALDYGVYDAQMARVMDKAASQLRRLAAVEAQRDALLEALKRYVDHFGDPLKCARAAIAKAEGEKA